MDVGVGGGAWRRRLRPGGGWNQDLLAGVLFLIFSGFALYLLWDLPMMRGTRVATGYFPKILVALIALLAVVLFVRGIASAGEGVTFGRLRPILFVIGSLLAFALLVRPAGFFVACMASVVLACLADPEHRLKSMLLVATGLSVAASIVFVGLLGVPARVLPW